MDVRRTTTLLVAPSGGPLAELTALRHRFADGLGPVEWATYDAPHSRELLAGEVVHTVASARPRDLRATWTGRPLARRILVERGITRVVATGGAVAAPFVVTARELGIAAHYVESAAHVHRPDLVGTLLAQVPGVHLYSQHPWQRPGWDVHGSVFDGFLSMSRAPARRIDRVVVTFGTQRGFDFRRAAARLARVLPALTTTSPDVLWQTGATDTFGLDIDSAVHVPHAELAAAIGEADLVVSHAGVGSALLSLGLGRVPVLVPRRRAHHEHADDHQVQLAEHLESRGLADHLEVEELTPGSLFAATARTVVAARPSHFELKSESATPRRAVRRGARVGAPAVPRQRRPDDRAIDRAGRSVLAVPAQRAPADASRRFTVLGGGRGED